MPMCKSGIRWGISSVALFAALTSGQTTTAGGGDRPVVVRPAIRITVSPGSTPTARFVQYGYYSGGWGNWSGGYPGWGGYWWGGYGGWGAFGDQSYDTGWGGFAPVYGTYYG